MVTLFGPGPGPGHMSRVDSIQTTAAMEKAKIDILSAPAVLLSRRGTL